MKLSELAKHVSNLEKLSLFLMDEITKRKVLEVKMYEKEQNLLKNGLSKESKEVLATIKKLKDLHYEKIQLRDYRESLYAIVDLEAQIPTRL